MTCRVGRPKWMRLSKQKILPLQLPPQRIRRGVSAKMTCTPYAACSALVFALISTNRPLNRLPRGTWRVQLSLSCRGQMSAPPAPLCVQGIAASRAVMSSFLSRHSAAAARNNHALTHSDRILLTATFELLSRNSHWRFEVPKALLKSYQVCVALFWTQNGSTLLFECTHYISS